MSQNDTQQNPEKLKTKISDEAERKRRENALDEAIENTFPASDPVSAEQPLHAHGRENPPAARRQRRQVTYPFQVMNSGAKHYRK